MHSEIEMRALILRTESKLMKGMDRSAPNVMVPIDDLRTLLQIAEKAQRGHPLDCLHINRGSMDAAADAYEAEYRTANAQQKGSGDHE